MVEVSGDVSFGVIVNNIQKSDAKRRRLLQTIREMFIDGVSRDIRAYIQQDSLMKGASLDAVEMSNDGTRIDIALSMAVKFMSDQSSAMHESICAGFEGVMGEVGRSVSSLGFTADVTAKGDVMGMTELGMLKCNVVASATSVSDSSSADVDATTASATAGGIIAVMGIGSFVYSKYRRRTLKTSARARALSDGDALPSLRSRFGTQSGGSLAGGSGGSLSRFDTLMQQAGEGPIAMQSDDSLYAKAPENYQGSRYAGYTYEAPLETDDSGMSPELVALTRGSGGSGFRDAEKNPLATANPSDVTLTVQEGHMGVMQHSASIGRNGFSW